MTVDANGWWSRSWLADRRSLTGLLLWSVEARLVGAWEWRSLYVRMEILNVRLFVIVMKLY